MVAATDHACAQQIAAAITAEYVYALVMAAIAVRTDATHAEPQLSEVLQPAHSQRDAFNKRLSKLADARCDRGQGRGTSSARLARPATRRCSPACFTAGPCGPRFVQSEPPTRRSGG